MPAPKLSLPGHIESYNPPSEYLFDSTEEIAWKESDPTDRKLNFLPRQHSASRLVPLDTKISFKRGSKDAWAFTWLLELGKLDWTLKIQTRFYRLYLVLEN